MVDVAGLTERPGTVRLDTRLEEAYDASYLPDAWWAGCRNFDLKRMADSQKELL